MILNQDSVRDLMIVWVDRVVFSQFYLVITLSLFTIGLMIFRRRREQRLERLKTEYAELFVNELISLTDPQPQLLLNRPSKWGCWLKAEALQETLLSQINALGGSERDYAVKRYIDLGFAQDDIELCTSHYWWLRLEGVSHLNALKTDSFARVFNYMRKDENPLIALYSLLGLSVLKHSFNNPQLFESLSTYIHRQDNILLEITRNWSNAFGLQKLAEYISRTSSTEFRNTFISAICHLKTAESAPVLNEFLKSKSEEFSAELIAEIIQAIREIGDPSIQIDVEKFLGHKSDLVRQRALEFLITVNFDIPKNLVPIIENDSSPGVRRIYEDWIGQGHAA